MASSFSHMMPKAFVETASVTDHLTLRNNLSDERLTLRENSSLRDDCIQVVVNDQDYIPWDNPDNIVSTEVEAIVRQIKNNLLVLLFLIGGPANVINMVVFFKQGLKDRVHLCLFALAIADELHLITAMFSYGEQLHVQFTTKQGFGPIMTYLANKNLLVFFANTYVSPVLSAVIATERCLCVLDPLKFHHLLRTRTMLAIVIMVNVVVYGLFFIVVYRYRIQCVYDPVSKATEMMVVDGEFYKAHKALIDHLDSFVFGVGLHGIVIIVVLTTTIITGVKLRHAATWRSGASSSLSRSEMVLSKMLVANSILFIVCVTPEAINRFSWLFFPEVNSGRRHHNFYLTGLWVAEIFLYINATFNIFLYYTMGSRYRKTFWSLFRSKSWQGKG